MKSKLNYIDLFAGCGGLSLGLKNAGWKGVFAIEKGEDAFKTLKYNLIDKSNHFNWPSEIPQTHHEINQFLVKYDTVLHTLQNEIDLVAGGPPCQGFSVAGRRQENDIRNDLVNSYIKFITIVKPKLILFENVRGFTLQFLKNKDQGVKYSQLVLEALNDIGYDVKSDIIDFSNFGIPQRRKRFLLVGARKDLNLGKELNNFFKDISESSEVFLAEKGLSLKTTLSESISDLLKANGEIESIESKNFFSGTYSAQKTPYQRYIRLENELHNPDSHRFANHGIDIVNKFEEIIRDPQKNKSINGDIRNKYNIKKHRVVPLDADEICPTLTTLPDDIIHYCEPRILTVREYARIQTFPDWFEFKGKYTTGGKRRVLEVPRYSQIGNAIPPLFSEQCGVILKNMLS